MHALEKIVDRVNKRKKATDIENVIFKTKERLQENSKIETEIVGIKDMNFS